MYDSALASQDWIEIPLLPVIGKNDTDMVQRRIRRGYRIETFLDVITSINDCLRQYDVIPHSKTSNVLLVPFPVPSCCPCRGPLGGFSVLDTS